ncbi:MAG: hypothetical protein Q8O98_02700 [bacterium]|nr:hypothetical protein [bacterium]
MRPGFDSRHSERRFLVEPEERSEQANCFACVRESKSGAMSCEHARARAGAATEASDGETGVVADPGTPNEKN